MAHDARIPSDPPAISKHRRDALLRLGRTGPLRGQDGDELRQLLASETDLLALSRLTRASDAQVRGWALLRLSAVEPRRVERHLDVFRHCMAVTDLAGAQRALDVAEAVAPKDRRVLWARLESVEGLPADEVLAVVVCYEERFPGDPILGMVRERCRRQLRMLDEGDQGEEPVVILEPMAPPIPDAPVVDGSGSGDGQPETVPLDVS